MIRLSLVSITSASLLLMALLTGSGVGHAQQTGCESGEGFGSFDFWLGEWDVTDSTTGSRAGSNSIQELEAGCMLLESWTSAGGGSGTSINYYNPVNDEWRQLWVSAGGYSIDIVGGMEGGSMKLSGNIYYFTGSVARFRGTWTPNSDESVRQFFEQYNDETNSWDVWFDGHYVRK